ncbi:hypothetical protein Tco_0831451 [Tanacetum coccineum]
MTTLADKSLLSGGDNKPPMLEKHLYDSWKSRMELYMLNRPHGRMILASVEKGPLVWPSITVDGATRLKEYIELTPAEAIQADCDIKAINIILQGLPTKIYALVSQHRVAKDLWEKIKLLMQGTSKQNKNEILASTIVDAMSHAYLQQHERHANEVRLMHERNSDPLALVASHQLPPSTYQSHLHTLPNSQLQHHVSPYPSSQFVTPYQTQQFTTNSGLIVPVFQKGDDLIDAINHMMSFLTVVVTSRGDKLLMLLEQRENTHLEQVEATQGNNRLTSVTICKGRNASDELTEYLVKHKQKLSINSNSSAQQDDLILTMFDQLNTQVMNCTNVNLEYKSANKALTTELDRYKEEVKDLKEMQNVENSFSGSNEQYAEIERLKQTLSEQVQEKDSLMKTVSDLKNDLKMEENRNIDREIALEKKIKQLDNIIFKRGQSAQTVHMMTKSKICYDHSTKQAIGFEKPFYLKKVRESKPKLYDGNVILKMDAIVIPDSDETLMLCEESRSKMLLKEQDPMVAVEQHRLESRTFEVKMNQVLSENERLLAQAIDYDIVKTVVNLSVNDGCETVNKCQKCLELKTELLNKKDVVDKETKNNVLDQNAPSFTQLFKLSELRAQSQEKDTVIVKLKEQIKVTKLVAENEHLKQTYKQLYDSIKPKRVQSKEQCDALIKQVNIKSGEISDLNAKLQEQGLVLAALKNKLRKLKGKALDKEAIETHSVDPKVSKDNMEPITPKLLNKRTAHSSYIKHTQEEALVLRDIVKHVKANYPQDSLLESAFRYTKVIQDLLLHISRTCPSINNFDPQLVAVTPRKKDKKVRFAESLTSTENTKTDSTSNLVSNKRVLHSTGVRLSTSASGSQPSGNTRNDRILQIPSSNSKNKNSKKHDNSDYVCINGDDCMSSDNLCVSNSMNDVKFRAKSKKRKSKKEIWKPTGKVFNKIGYIWRPTGRTFTIVGNACPLTRITTTNEVPSRKPIVLKSESPKPVVKLVYSRKPRKNKNTESVSKTKVIKPMSAKSSSCIWTPVARST